MWIGASTVAGIAVYVHESTIALFAIGAAAAVSFIDAVVN